MFFLQKITQCQMMFDDLYIHIPFIMAISHLPSSTDFGDSSPVASHGAEDDEILLSTLELVHRGDPGQMFDGFFNGDFMVI